MNEEYLKQYLKEMKEYTSNDSLNDIKCFQESKTLNETSNDIKGEKFISKEKYLKMIVQLEAWNVFKPKSLTFKYGVERCYNVFEYVLNTPNVKNKGAYFRKCLSV